MTNETHRHLKVRCIVGVVAGALLVLLAMTSVGSKAGVVILYDDRAPTHAVGSNPMHTVETNLW
jgi:hypothetical protein